MSRGGSIICKIVRAALSVSPTKIIFNSFIHSAFFSVVQFFPLVVFICGLCFCIFLFNSRSVNINFWIFYFSFGFYHF
uniref:Uncharacterized protein n=1 Tax=Anguilla anguilla TaxID=7936 RepID=A0A0E9X5J2_ANGAN